MKLALHLYRGETGTPITVKARVLLRVAKFHKLHMFHKHV